MINYNNTNNYVITNVSAGFIRNMETIGTYFCYLFLAPLEK